MKDRKRKQRNESCPFGREYRAFANKNATFSNNLYKIQLFRAKTTLSPENIAHSLTTFSINFLK